MRLPMQIDLNTNSVIMLLLAVACVGGGIYCAQYSYLRIMAVGLILTGIGNAMFGITHGFSDPTPTGRLLFRIGAAAYIIGIPPLALGVYRLLETG